MIVLRVSNSYPAERVSVATKVFVAHADADYMAPAMFAATIRTDDPKLYPKSAVVSARIVKP